MQLIFQHLIAVLCPWVMWDNRIYITSQSIIKPLHITIHFKPVARQWNKCAFTNKEIWLLREKEMHIWKNPDDEMWIKQQNTLSLHLILSSQYACATIWPCIVWICKNRHEILCSNKATVQSTLKSEVKKSIIRAVIVSLDNLPNS